MTVKQDVYANAAAFSAKWPAELDNCRQSLSPNSKFSESYARMAAFNGLKDAIASEMTVDCAAFLLEAQNDLLTSHILANLGIWRGSLQSLRSFLENSLAALYFMDHPVELRLWTKGQVKLSFSELIRYFEKHPDTVALPDSITGLPILTAEYGTLSRAVHGSAINMRMTGGGAVLLSSSEMPRLGAWATRQTAAIRGILLLCICLKKRLFEGNRLPGVRSVIGAALTANSRASLKTHLTVTIPAFA